MPKIKQVDRFPQILKWRDGVPADAQSLNEIDWLILEVKELRKKTESKVNTGLPVDPRRY